MSIRTATCLAWAMAVLSIALAVLGAVLIAGTPAASRPSGYQFLQLYPLANIAFSIVGALIISRRPENRIGWLTCAIGLLSNVWPFAGDYVRYAVVTKPGVLPGSDWMAWLNNWEWLPPTMLVLVFLPLLFPDGRLLSRRWRLVAGLTAAITAIFVLRAAFAPTTFDGKLKNPIGIPAVAGIGNRVDAFVQDIAIVVLVLAAVSLILRFRRAQGEQRLQLKWFTSAVALLALVTIPSIALRVPVSESPNILAVLFGLAILSLPVAIGFSVLKYHLYDIDVVINKSVVFGTLAAFITAVYVAVVVGIGALVGTGGRPNLALSILATALVAVAFQPVRERVQHVANRLVYGERATPYEVMADFSERMAGALSVEEVLPKMAEAAAHGAGAARSRVRVFLPGGGEKSTAWPANSLADHVDRTLEVAYRGELVGEIAVFKPAGEPLTPAEGKLLADLAAQAGLVLHNVRLTVELQARLAEISARATMLRASRQRIVAAQDAERRRLERNIHDGAQRQLASMAALLRRTEDLLSEDPKQAATCLDGLMAQANQALETLRDLARGIYPPLLRDQGLVAALRAQAAKMATPVEVSTDRIGRYPSEVEAAIYFCCLEALRTAEGRAAIHLAARGDAIDFSVMGSGLAPDGRLQDMEDRVEALGGHLELRDGRLAGRIPARVG